MFYFDNFFGKKILKSNLLSDVDCFFTTREFVLTPSVRSDLEIEALNNRKFLLQNLEVDKITTAVQTHSSNIALISCDKDLYEDTDALISNTENTLLLMNFADCVPIILYAKQYNTGAIVHAGWRGTAAEILRKTVIFMKDSLNIKPQDITALIGPAIGKCCFETDEDVFTKLIKDVNKTYLYENKGDKFFIDLKELNNIQLLECGVENIDICSYCTCCKSDIFYSYRKEKGVTARHSAIIKIKRGQKCR